MRFFRRRESTTLVPSRKLGIIEELDLIWRRVRSLALMAPVLLLVGFGAGNLATALLKMPAGKTVRFSTYVPHIHVESFFPTFGHIYKEGAATVDYVKRYREDIEPVEKVLLRHGVPQRTAHKISWPVVQEAERRGVDPAMVTAILLVESEGNPTARSSVGARGLMQVMPGWAGRWHGCGRDLYDIAANICNGTSILAWYLDSHGDERSALLGYNGCVNGANTPNCHRYPDKIWSLRAQIKRELEMYKPKPAESSASD